LATAISVNAHSDYHEDVWEPDGYYSNSIAVDIEQGLICHLDFDSIINGIVFDSSNNGHYGTVMWASVSEGIIGRGLSFDGRDSYVEVQNAAVSGLEGSLGNLPEGTISLWFKLHSFPGVYSASPIFYFGDFRVNTPTYSDHSSLLIEVGHSVSRNRKLFYTISKDGSVYYCYNSIEDLELNQWYHFVSVVNKENCCQGVQEAYLNGEEMLFHYNYGKNDNPQFFDYVPKNEVCWIGKGFYSYLSEPVYFHGAVDELRIYDRPLNQLQVMHLYQQKFRCEDSDVNYDSHVDMKDFAILANSWLTGNSEADINYDGFVDHHDLSMLSSRWLYTCRGYE
jgi:hypothetical protein